MTGEADRGSAGPGDGATQDHAARAGEPQPAVEGLALAGTVTDFDGLPLVGVRVEAACSGGGDLDLLPALTDGEGRFLLQGLAAGRYDLRFALGGVRGRALAVPAGTEDLRVRLARPQGLLLVVKTVPGEEPPALVHVVLERETDVGRRREHVGRHLASRLLLWSLRPGTWRATVWGGPFLPVHAEGIRVVDGQPPPEVEVLLAARGGTLRGVVRDGAGRAQGDLLVAWRRVDGPDPWPRHLAGTTTDADGRFAARGLPAGRWRVSAGTPTGPVADVEADVAEGAEQPLEIVLAAP